VRVSDAQNALCDNAIDRYERRYGVKPLELISKMGITRTIAPSWTPPIWIFCLYFLIVAQYPSALLQSGTFF
jgi:hypothetical protein